MKYIYLMQSIEDGYYKIGVSNSPNLRIKQLNTGNPSLIKLIATYPTESAYMIEGILHRRYSYYRIKNKEWFDLSIKEEVGFIGECARIEQSIDALKVSGNVFI